MVLETEKESVLIYCNRPLSVSVGTKVYDCNLVIFSAHAENRNVVSETKRKNNYEVCWNCLYCMRSLPIQYCHMIMVLVLYSKENIRICK